MGPKSKSESAPKAIEPRPGETTIEELLARCALKANPHFASLHFPPRKVVEDARIRFVVPSDMLHTPRKQLPGYHERRTMTAGEIEAALMQHKISQRVPEGSDLPTERRKRPTLPEVELELSDNDEAPAPLFEFLSWIAKNGAPNHPVAVVEHIRLSDKSADLRIIHSGACAIPFLTEDRRSS